MKTALVLTFLCAVAPLATALCPNACSNNGKCGEFDSCECYSGFYGAACQYQTCPYGEAWMTSANGDLNMNGDRYDMAIYSQTPLSDHPTKAGLMTQKQPGGAWESYAPDAGFEAHHYMECSNRGTCDRDNGLCECFEGYTGHACQRNTCPNDCSGNGQCILTSEQAAESGVAYNLWDADMSAFCSCDPGFTGFDCASQVCPMGDDPLTTGQHRETQYLSVSGDEVLGLGFGGTFSVSFTDTNGKVWTTDEVSVEDFANLHNVGQTPDEDMVLYAGLLESAMESVPNDAIRDVQVEAMLCKEPIHGEFFPSGIDGNDVMDDHDDSIGSMCAKGQAYFHDEHYYNCPTLWDAEVVQYHAGTDSGAHMGAETGYFTPTSHNLNTEVTGSAPTSVTFTFTCTEAASPQFSDEVSWTLTEGQDPLGSALISESGECSGTVFSEDLDVGTEYCLHMSDSYGDGWTHQTLNAPGFLPGDSYALTSDDGQNTVTMCYTVPAQPEPVGILYEGGHECDRVVPSCSMYKVTFISGCGDIDNMVVNVVNVVNSDGLRDSETIASSSFVGSASSSMTGSSNMYLSIYGQASEYETVSHVHYSGSFLSETVSTATCEGLFGSHSLENCNAQYEFFKAGSVVDLYCGPNSVSEAAILADSANYRGAFTIADQTWNNLVNGNTGTSVTDCITNGMIYQDGACYSELQNYGSTQEIYFVEQLPDVCLSPVVRQTENIVVAMGVDLTDFALVGGTLDFEGCQDTSPDFAAMGSTIVKAEYKCLGEGVTDYSFQDNSPQLKVASHDCGTYFWVTGSGFADAFHEINECISMTVVTDGTTECSECSDRGMCGSDGICQCHEGYTGVACEIQQQLSV